MARVKGYSSQNYYSQQKIKSSSESVNISISKGTAQKLINNLYVHSGLYTFRSVVKGYNKNSNQVVKKLITRMKKDFEKEIRQAKKFENQIYNAAGVNTRSSKSIQDYLSFDTMAQKTLDNLNVYSLIDEVLSRTEVDEKGYFKVANVQRDLTNLFSERASDIASNLYDKQQQDIFSHYKNVLSVDQFLQAQKDEKVALKKLQNGTQFFVDATKYQGKLGEVAGLLNAAIKNKSAIEFTTEVENGLSKVKNTKIVNIGAQNLKSDIGVKLNSLSFGIQVKNYKNFKNNIGVHTGRGRGESESTNILKNLFGVPILAQAGEDLKLSSIFKEAGVTNTEFQRFIQYCIINAESFKKAGVYLKPENKKEAKKPKKGKLSEEAYRQKLQRYNDLKKQNTYTTYNAYNQEIVFIKEFTNLLATYWLGVKILEGNKKMKNERNAFFLLGSEMVPISKILQIILDNLSTDNPVIVTKFSGVKVYSPNILKNEKWKALYKTSNPPSNWNRKREYPDQLLRVGSAIGQASLDSITFSIEMDVKKILNI